MLRQTISARMRSAGRTVGDLWRLASHPHQTFRDAEASADIFRDLCEGGLVVSTAFPTAEQLARLEAAPASGAAAGDAEPIALRTVLQADGDVALLVDRGLADGDQRVLRALVQVHSAAVREALGPLVRAQAIAAALRASLGAAVSTCGLTGAAAAHWLAGLAAALMWGAITATATGALFFSARWSLERYMRRKARALLQE